MARSFLSSISALAAAAGILLRAGASPAFAQPLAPSLPASSAPEPVQIKYPEVQEALQLLLGPAHDMAGAIKFLEVSAKKYPELPTAHVVLYQVLSQLNQPGPARFQLEIAVNTSPNDPEAYIILGNIALQERRIWEASQDFEKAKQVLANFTNKDRKGSLEQQTLSGLASVAETREDWVDAASRLEDLLKAASPDEPNLDARQRVARAMFEQGKAQEAYDILKEAKKLDKANAAKTTLGKCYFRPKPSWHNSTRGSNVSTPTRSGSRPL